MWHTRESYPRALLASWCSCQPVPSPQLYSPSLHHNPDDFASHAIVRKVTTTASSRMAYPGTHFSKAGDAEVNIDDFTPVTAYPGRRTDGTRNEATRVRRLFSFVQIFFFALTFMSSWETMALNLSAVLYNGGPQTLAWGILVVAAGALAQSASLAEMASLQPIAGAQYHWTHYLAPPSQRRFITWMQGWITWFGWVSLLAGVANTTAYMLQSLVVVNNPSYVPERWHLTLIIFALVIFQGLMNVYTFWIIPWIELMAGILHILMFVIFVAVLTSLSSRHKSQWVFFNRETQSGWDNSYVSWNLGLLTPTWGFVGFDGAIHMSEEVRRAKQAVPRAIFWTVALNAVLAYAIIMVILFCSGDLDAVLAAPFPIIEICQQATGSTAAATAMVCGLLIISMAVNLGSIASASRLTWAWSRDGALPAWFSYVGGWQIRLHFTDNELRSAQNNEFQFDRSGFRLSL